ncbi:uncharacterized protein LOC108632229 [Ceratina calcarata]|uniref:Uncharacterized protein LOC108632229 n=1 Tax=Ceratina calcarata TaxID=156304 RepID=A0AAJ7JGK7_9HYME|nr:uncharacterized protein LOC108632229 [Ceratina calcarata]
MLNKSKVKSATRVNENRRKKPTTASSNLHASPSLIGKFRRRKQKSHFSKSTADTANAEKRATSANSNAKSEQENPQKDSRITSTLPEDTAVHFGRFYGVEDANKPKAGRVKTSSDPTAVPYYRLTPRLEFTRQMVQKLERTAGTEEYARQVSALLEETVEPAHFKLHSLPTENSIPDGRHNPTGFPLWYKEPFKMPFTSDEVYKLLKEKFDNAERKAKNIFDEEASDNNSLEEWPGDEQGENESLGDNEEKDILTREKSSVHLLSNGSSSVTEAKDTDSRESNDTSSSDAKPRKVQFLQRR